MEGGIDWRTYWVKLGGLLFYEFHVLFHAWDDGPSAGTTAPAATAAETASSAAS